mmetsp:Transcript_24388/g.67554  ORF Transcript_24388/g.67554 Transcript_24388/m.67554 type:complete len:120 (+) Transcript_24388:1800-2159(+)
MLMPGSNQRNRHGQQYKWPHCVTTGSSTASRQMLQLNRESDSILSCGWDGGCAFEPGPLRHEKDEASKLSWEGLDKPKGLLEEESIVFPFPLVGPQSLAYLPWRAFQFNSGCNFVCVKR